MKFIDMSFDIQDDINGDRVLRNLLVYGRTCYKSVGNTSTDTAKKFVGMLIKNGHESVLEHEKITVKFIVDRGVTHEMVRHRVASYSQESTRYCNYSGEKFDGQCSVILPDELKKFDMVTNYLIMGEEIYNQLIKDYKVKPEVARDILPTCLKAEIVMTANLREWRHYLKLRTSEFAHPKIRKISTDLLNEFKRLIPVVFDDIEGEEL